MQHGTMRISAQAVADRRLSKSVRSSWFCVVTILFGTLSLGNSAMAGEPRDTVISETDLSKPLGLHDDLKLVVTQGPEEESNPGFPGKISFYLIHNGEKQQYDVGTFNKLDSLALVLPYEKASKPLLVVQANNEYGAPGSAVLSTMIWTYRDRTKTLDLIWNKKSNPNRNEETRMMTSGPLAGDIIMSIDDPTGHRPWRYGIDVYKLFAEQNYKKILSFVGQSAQVGGPPGNVIDADMPETLKRLQK